LDPARYASVSAFHLALCPFGWVETDGFVDIPGGQALLGHVDGRTSVAVSAWRAERTEPPSPRPIRSPQGPRSAAIGSY